MFSSKEYYRQYFKKNKAKWKAYRQKYYKENKEKILDYQKEYYEKNKKTERNKTEKVVKESVKKNKTPDTILEKLAEERMLKDAPKFREYIRQLLKEYEKEKDTG